MADETATAGRVRHHWKVPMQDATGQAFRYDVFGFWGPDHELTRDTVETCARVQAMSERKRECVVVGAPELVA